MFDLSIILATKNEEKNLINFFSFLNKKKENIEIIIIDNNSTDKTLEIASRYLKKKNIITLNNAKNYLNPRGKQINIGVDRCNSDNIFFPDADMIFNYDLLEEAIKKLKVCDALYVPEKINNDSFFGNIRNFERSFYNFTVIDAFRFVKKNIFIKANGFDEKNIRFGPDDWDFTLRIKKLTNKISITDNSLLHNETKLSIQSYLMKKIKYSSSFKEYKLKWKGNSSVKKQFSFLYRFFIVFAEHGKWKQLLKKPIYYFLILLIKFIIGLYYILSKYSK